MSYQQPRCERYTMGIICALPIELAALQKGLDREDKPFQDNLNIYTLGNMSGHKAVVVCLQHGRPGLSSAAIVAKQMESTFPKLQHYLLCGIGGGVPSDVNDIRLGDVVVSVPDNFSPGVIQYDMGKATADGFKRTGSLNSPPHILLSAVQHLMSDELRGKSQIFSDLPKFGPKFQRPSVTDGLFEPAYVHAGAGPNDCSGCDPAMQIVRKKRSDDMPKVHYGTIASGNQVIKNGLVRDRLNHDLGGVMCVEMEAAGLMNNFQCIVIRGIADYADSHKNDEWQPYSAATMVSVVKSLLRKIPLPESEGTRTQSKRSTNRKQSQNAAEADLQALFEYRDENRLCFNCGHESHWEIRCWLPCGNCYMRNHTMSDCIRPAHG